MYISLKFVIFKIRRWCIVLAYPNHHQ